MNVLCVGISHHTAPLEQRERLWFSNDEIQTLLPEIRGMGIDECVLFSTCNRTELYTYTADGVNRVDELKQLLLKSKQAAEHVPASSFFSISGQRAAQHLFRVASGVDSLVLGDVQILMQVKDGFALATEQKTAGFFMNRLFQTALHTGKRSRTETRIGDGAVSVSYAAVDLAEKIFDSLEHRTAMVLGAGETAELTARHLRGRNIGKLMIVNRTVERAQHLAESVQGTVVPFDVFCDHLPNVDIIISSVSVETYILTKDDIRKIEKQRQATPLFIIDIGMPRNIDPAARELENVFVYDIDSLQTMVDKNLQKRQEEVQRVEAVIAEELKSLDLWHSSLQASPIISALTELAEHIRRDEVAKNIHRFDERDRELLEIVTKRIVNKILHQPIANLRNGHEDSQSERMHTFSIVQRIFGLRASEEQKRGK